MLVLFDTSVFIAGFVESHPKHATALKWLQKAKAGEIKLIVAAHTLIECYAVLTRLPLSPKISPADAAFLIQENITRIATVNALNASEYVNLIKGLVEKGLSGGIVYDGIIIQVAKKFKVKKIITFNKQDFLRLSPENSAWIIDP